MVAAKLSTNFTSALTFAEVFQTFINISCLLHRKRHISQMGPFRIQIDLYVMKTGSSIPDIAPSALPSICLYLFKNIPVCGAIFGQLSVV